MNSGKTIFSQLMDFSSFTNLGNALCTTREIIRLKALR